MYKATFEHWSYHRHMVDSRYTTIPLIDYAEAERLVSDESLLALSLCPCMSLLLASLSSSMVVVDT